MNKEYVYFALPIVVFIINRIPYIGKYLRVVNTLIHESGHAIATLVTSGQVYSVELFSDTSGSAITKTKGKFRLFLVSIAGYPFGSAVACLLFYIISIDKCLIALYILACVALLNLMFYVRNPYGIFWLVSFTAIIFVVKFYGGEFVQFVFTAWLSGIMLFEALYSSVVLLLIAKKKSKSAGDAYSLEKLTGVPAFIWASMFVAQSVFFIYLTIRLIF